MNRTPNIPKNIEPEERFLIALRMLTKSHAIAIDDLEKKVVDLEDRIKALEALHVNP